MSKKNKKNRATPVDDKVVETVVETQVEPGAPPPADAVAVPAPVYGLIATAEELAKRNIRKGFETVLIAELGNAPGTCQELVDRMLASGEFARVAPRAAELRPTKPTQFLLTKWVGGGIVAIASPEEAAAHNEAAAAAASEELEPAGSDELPGEGSTAEAEATASASV